MWEMVWSSTGQGPNLKISQGIKLARHNRSALDRDRPSDDSGIDLARLQPY